ncbi:Retrovirus-related Pol polyprotein from transposon TNT 1-94 [Gossypium australe]|uniref:Retrovirus-related Pol polyprotein from transposon TNT 1-94 n=1 Tax=Gossypium australe TaxID=47621 RepID=A0A5B6UFI1_9ROSI|nr:Retrovirus-related Pol polyprotein from transposon TNT 1-94 [Gossypium australe]
MRQGGIIEGVLQAKSQSYKGGKSKENMQSKNKQTGCSTDDRKKATTLKFFLVVLTAKRPIAHKNGVGGVWIKCGQLGHVEKIYMSPQQEGEANTAKNQQDGEQMFVASCFTTSNSTESWLIDSGCTNYMSYDRELFKEVHLTTISRVRN